MADLKSKPKISIRDHLSARVYGVRAQVGKTLLLPVTFQDFCRRVQIHGLADIYQARSPLSRVAWFLIVGTMMGLLVDNVRVAVKEFTRNNFVTSTSVESVENIPFPKVVICPYNFFNYEKFVDHHGNKWREQLSDLISVDEAVNAFEQLYVINKTNAFAEPDVKYASNAEEHTVHLKEFSHEVEDVFIHCKFANMPIVCSEQIDKRIFNSGRVCYAFHTARQQSEANIGLEIQLTVIDSFDTNFGNLPLTGVKVYVDYRHPYSNKVYVRAGERSKIGLGVVEQHLVNDPEQRCLPKETGDSYTYKILGATYYDEKLCRRECTQEVIHEKCGCIQFEDDKDLSSEFRMVRICRITDIVRCTKGGTRIAEFFAQRKTCIKKCITPCDMIKIKTQENAIGFTERNMTKYALNYTRGNHEPSGDVRSLVVLDISFGDMITTNVTQAYTFSANMFISNVGGLMGLWVGASMLSLIQAVILGVTATLNRIMGTRVDVTPVEKH